MTAPTFPNQATLNWMARLVTHVVHAVMSQSDAEISGMLLAAIAAGKVRLERDSGIVRVIVDGVSLGEITLDAGDELSQKYH